MSEMVNVFWFRRDLRLSDNAALYYALRSGRPVLPVFIFDSNILDELDDKKDPRVAFIYRSLSNIQESLIRLGSTLHVFIGTPEKVFSSLISLYSIESVFTNRDYEPYATERDNGTATLLGDSGIGFFAYKDQVVFDPVEIVKDDATPYTVFTPFSKKWKLKLDDYQLKPYPTSKYFINFFKHDPIELPSLSDIGFEATNRAYPPELVDEDVIKHYHTNRDFPDRNGTSKLGVHLRFGTISIRSLASLAQSFNQVYINELIWREFYQMILWRFPRVGKGQAFKPAYEGIKWRNNEDEFDRWCKGLTGYPLVDAGMRELNETGFMHNRVRMVVASFLCKHLLIDWRWGETYFASKLMDFDLASNNGGWQWAAGSGCDAAPYFRIFNPYIQAKKFDPKGRYIGRWIPDLNEFSYATPIVDHEFARKRCIDVYSTSLKERS